jgi:hypothetical protein
MAFLSSARRAVAIRDKTTGQSISSAEVAEVASTAYSSRNKSERIEGRYWGDPGGVDQRPCDSVELANVTGGEHRQDRSERGQIIGSGKDFSHTAVTMKGHVIDRVRPGEHPRDQSAHLQLCVAAK